jgi:hypothetical protein
LRSSFADGDWTFEATVEDGVIRSSRPGEAAAVEGFDLASYDEMANLVAMWQLCFGRRAIREGESAWGRFVRERGLETEGASISTRLQAGQLAEPRTRPTVLGEIQFGNWGLLYRDLLKLVAADLQLDIDLFIYITATESLSAALSASTVNYLNALRNGLTSFANLIRVPVWLIGLDLPTDFATLPREDVSVQLTLTAS